MATGTGRIVVAVTIDLPSLSLPCLSHATLIVIAITLDALPITFVAGAITHIVAMPSPFLPSLALIAVSITVAAVTLFFTLVVVACPLYHCPYHLPRALVFHFHPASCTCPLTAFDTPVAS